MEKPIAFNALPVYRKALEIFKVSRAIAYAVSDKQHVMEMCDSSRLKNRFAGEIITDSLRLAPELAGVQSATCSILRLKRAKKIQKAVHRILHRCRKLEFHSAKEKEFLQLLRWELLQFEELFSEYYHNLQLKRKG